MSQWKEIPITAMKGFKIGHAQDEEHATGCTVILPDKKAVCGLDVRGGGPASRETQLLNPLMSNDGINGLLLSGGSFSIFITRPFSLVILIISFASLFYPMIRAAIAKKKEAK